MREERADHLPPTLERAVRLLREDEPVGADWRERVLHAIGTDEVPLEPTLRRRRMVPLRAAVAAAIVCTIAGSAATIGVLRRMQAKRPVAEMAQARARTPSALLPVHFSLVAPWAASVSIVGDFNQWSATALPMKRSADGRTWQIDVKLPEGRYNYAYLIDGHISRDPSAPQTGGDDYGMPNSVLMVSGT